MQKKPRDLVSGFSHLIGAYLSVAGLVVLIFVAVTQGTAWHIVSYSIFGASLLLLYTASTIYHLVPTTERGQKALRRLDHIMIFVLIAGTYTPFCLVPLRGTWGWTLLITVWAIGLAGVFLKVFWLEAPRWLYTGVYLGMGWLVVIAAFPMLQTVPTGGLIWLAIGGLFYSVGAIFYGIKWPNFAPDFFGFHELWHIFVLAGSFSHFWAVFKYISTVS